MPPFGFLPPLCLPLASLPHCAPLSRQVFEEYKTFIERFSRHVEKLPTRAFLAPLDIDEEVRWDQGVGGSVGATPAMPTLPAPVPPSAPNRTPSAAPNRTLPYPECILPYPDPPIHTTLPSGRC